MQVLLENPFNPLGSVTDNVTQSFWSDNCLYMDSNFSINAMLKMTDPVGLSPFFILDARIALLISLVSKNSSLLTRGLGPQAVVACLSNFKSQLEHFENPQLIDKYLAEYFPKSYSININKILRPKQIIIYNEIEIDLKLWEKLDIGGMYILGTTSKSPILNLSPSRFEAIGNLWPVGESTEFGWKFETKNDELGLNGFEIHRLKKIF